MFGGALNTSLKLPIILPRSEAVFPRLSTNFSGFYKIGYLVKTLVPKPLFK